MERKLILSLKEEWYRMIGSGVKTEEYRELKGYWDKRLSKEYDTIEFTLGYPKKGDEGKRMKFKWGGIRVGLGNPIWGAPNYSVYILKLGERIK